MSEGYMEVYKEKDRAEWFRAREICWWIYQPNADPKRRAKTREDFMPLDEKPVRAKRLPKKKLQQLAAEINAKLNSK